MDRMALRMYFEFRAATGEVSRSESFEGGRDPRRAIRDATDQKYQGYFARLHLSKLELVEVTDSAGITIPLGGPTTTTLEEIASHLGVRAVVIDP
jgi:hypothetical protein